MPFLSRLGPRAPNSSTSSCSRSKQKPTMATSSPISESMPEQTIDIESAALLTCTISFHSLEVRNLKSYPKIQQILGDLGGLFEICYISCLLLILPFNNLSYTVKLLNEFFNFDFDGQPMRMNAVVHPLPESHTQLRTEPGESPAKLTKSSHKLKSIFEKTIMLEKYNRQSKLGEKESESKQHLIDEISNEVTEFFKEQDKHIELSLWDYFFCCGNANKKSLIDNSLERVRSSLDITYIVKKLQEIDKLKLILMDPDQIRLFDYLPKPKIHFNQDPTEAQYCSLLRPEQSDLQKALDAQKAFQNLKMHTDPITLKLVGLLDEDLIQLFSIQIEKGMKRSANKAPQLYEAVQILLEQKRLKRQETVQQQFQSDSESNDSESLRSVNDATQRKKTRKSTRKQN